MKKIIFLTTIIYLLTSLCMMAQNYTQEELRDMKFYTISEGLQEPEKVVCLTVYPADSGAYQYLGKFINLQGLVFDGTEEWEVDLSDHEKREMIRWGLDELWEHGIPILSLSGGYYVLGNNPDVLLSEIHSLEENIRDLQAKVDSMRVHYVRQLKPFETLEWK